MNNLQKQVQAAIDELVESGAERGLQVSVYRHSDQVVDAIVGVAGYDEDPIFTDEKGIATFDGGAKVAYFRDPDGNTLSVAQVGRS